MNKNIIFFLIGLILFSLPLIVEGAYTNYPHSPVKFFGTGDIDLNGHGIGNGTCIGSMCSGSPTYSVNAENVTNSAGHPYGFHYWIDDGYHGNWRVSNSTYDFFVASETAAFVQNGAAQIYTDLYHPLSGGGFTQVNLANESQVTGILADAHLSANALSKYNSSYLVSQSPVNISTGGTGAQTAAGARANLGILENSSIVRASAFTTTSQGIVLNLTNSQMSGEVIKMSSSPAQSRLGWGNATIVSEIYPPTNYIGDAVGFYTGAKSQEAAINTSHYDLWAYNTVTDTRPGFNGTSFGTEADLNMFSGECPTAGPGRNGPCGIGLGTTGLGNHTTLYGLWVTRADITSNWSTGVQIDHATRGVYTQQTGQTALESPTAGAGFLLHSPDGTAYCARIANGGTWSITATAAC